MSWSRRTLVASALWASLLAGCGFAPVYGPGGGARALRGAIRVADPETEFGFDFVTRFEERIGRPDAARFALDWTLSVKERELAIDDENTITRFNLEGTLAWRLTPLGAEDPVLTGRESSFTSYSATGSTISTLESQQDAEQRLAVILADAVVARLLASDLT
ncbi:LPS assembly lipoprotein LptE [Jannaschia seohaensis]|uniref:LPS-assembly lipoprotein n=1 Tax=Jannaschia seohaensis TaxID=475081 RepID=A0A2Y9A2C6_9RHOB|nr:LPS assembly lipoprotein LptE [Jannaschia seohaensis]PWJ22286.1 LPS-assembly lipoprotein [Jannaschia seohaensis]SSA38564.1 LPS-assembly lipoprotein [Jannaschia seohaensis]